MRGWQVVHGDLQLGPKGLAEVSGSDKVTQDLNIATLEPFGVDRFHPRWGSLLQRMIGQPTNIQTEMLVKSEIIRMVNNYILIQQDKLSIARNAGQRSPYDSADLIQSVEDIAVIQNQDHLQVLVTLKTVAGQSVTLSNQVAA